jgi:hypothetical protein
VTLSMADDLAHRADTLLRLWSDLALRHVALGAACGCGAGGISLRLEDFELDIVDYLDDAGTRSGIAPVAAFFAGMTAAGPRAEPLRALLHDIGTGRVPADVGDWILPKVERTLRSFAELHGSGTPG